MNEMLLEQIKKTKSLVEFYKLKGDIIKELEGKKPSKSKRSDV